MEITIGKKTHELVFGIGFIRALDEKYYVEQAGVKFGNGANKAILGILDGNIPTLADVVQAAIPAAVSDKAVEEALGTYAIENDGLDGLFEEVLEGLKASPFIGNKAKEAEKKIKEILEQNS